MRPLLERNLLVVTGKGGVGKTTLAATLGTLAARRGARTIVVELGDQRRLRDLYGAPAPQDGSETQLAERLFATTIDPDRVLLEWVQELGGRIPGRVLASSSTFQYFAAAAPGAKELFAMVKVWELTQSRRWRRRAAGYDLVVLDAPATGHALGMLRSPQTFGAIARVGPVATQAQRVQDLLREDDRSGFVAVAQATDMAVSETLELQQGLREALGRELDAVLVNGLLPRRFSAEEMDRIVSLDGHPQREALPAGELAPGGRRRGGRRRGTAAVEEQIRHDAAHAAIAVHERARFQHNQVARLRRRSFEVLGVPFLWGAPVDVAAIEALADHLERRL